jgi:hypothetical protein
MIQWLDGSMIQCLLVEILKGVRYIEKTGVKVAPSAKEEWLRPVRSHSKSSGHKSEEASMQAIWPALRKARTDLQL